MPSLILQQHTEEIEKARPNDRNVGWHRVRIDDRRNGIRSIVKAIDELKTQRDEASYAQQQERQPDLRVGIPDSTMSDCRL